MKSISGDTTPRNAPQGWYHRKARYVENEMGQRFYLNFYFSKGLAYQRSKQQ